MAGEWQGARWPECMNARIAHRGGRSRHRAHRDRARVHGGSVLLRGLRLDSV